MSTVSDTDGSWLASVIVQTPAPSQPGPATLKAMMSAPAFELAVAIASRSDPAPESLVLITV